MAKKGGRTKWKTVKVPSEVHKVLKAKAKETNQAMHRVITSAILTAENKDLAEAAQKLPASAKNVDKAIWYCLKLVNGIAMYKQALKISTMIDAVEGEQIYSYTQSQREKLMNTIDQIEKRLKVDLTEVIEAVEEMEENRMSDGRQNDKTVQ
ncbi:MAG: hypothetical protein JRE40_12175 [Deltaproteobacteria bacterium]|nr:hypothetical protein [Deltaproteobacteria bacterium]